MLLAIAAAVVLSPASDAEQIRAVYARMAPAFAHRDWKAVRDMCTPDFTERYANGTTLKLKPILEGYEQAFKGLTQIKIDISAPWVEVHGASAETMAVYEIRAISADKARHAMRITGCERHHWRKTGAKWRQTDAVELDNATWIDGKLSAFTK